MHPSADAQATSRRSLLQAAGAVSLAAMIDQLSISAANASPLDDLDEVDYIVIGSGPGGSPLAVNLARAGFTVAVLEAGPAHGSKAFYDVPALNLRAVTDPQVRWDYFVRHYSDPSKHGSQWVPEQGGVLYPRSGALGGCTAHHAMISMYPNHSDFEHIEQLTGDAGWGRNRMWDRYQDVRTWQSFEDSLIALGMRDLMSLDDQLPRYYLAALMELPGLPGYLPTLDPRVNSRLNVDLSSQGFFVPPSATRNSTRIGPREHLLLAAAQLPARLVVQTDALVERVVLQPGASGRMKATGVEVLLKPYAYGASPLQVAVPEGERAPYRRTLRARREVIVSAGAFNSPQILMLSGIGQASHLAPLGITSLVDLPGVGQNLQDRYEVSVTTRLQRPLRLLEDCEFTGTADDPAYVEWRTSLMRAFTPYSAAGCLGGIRLKSNAGLKDPDQFVFASPADFTGYRPGFDDQAYQHDCLTWLILKARSSRIGSVRLRSADPTMTPAINKRSFEDGRGGGADVDELVDSVEMVRRINARAGLGDEMSPGPALRSRADLSAWVRREAWGHHASCSNPIGADSDPNAVLNGRFEVRGTEGLRVVDASAFPRIPGLFLWLATAMLSEKASRDILDQS